MGNFQREYLNEYFKFKNLLIVEPNKILKRILVLFPTGHILVIL